MLTFTAGDTALVIWGGFPDSFANWVQVGNYLSHHEFEIGDYDDVMADLADFGFTDVGGLGLYRQNTDTGDWDPIVTAETDDLEALVNYDTEEPEDGYSEYGYDYTNAQGATESVVQEVDGLYNIVGYGIDLDTLYGILDGETVSETGV